MTAARDRKALQRIRPGARPRQADAGNAALNPDHQDSEAAGKGITLRLWPRAGLSGFWGSIGPADARLIVSAINGGWVTDDMGEALAVAMTRLVKGADPRSQIAAGRVLTALASVDVSRERNDTTERGQDLAALTATVQSLARDHPELYGRFCDILAEVQRAQSSQTPAPSSLPPPAGT